MLAIKQQHRRPGRRPPARLPGRRRRRRRRADRRLPRAARAARRLLAAEPAVSPFNAYVNIAPDGTVTVLSAHMDGGQGIYTGVATLVAEELDADWAGCGSRGPAGNPKLYGNIALGGAFQGTGGSTAIPSSWERYRRAGAVARAMLVQAAAEGWGVPAGEIRVEKGVLSHPARAGRRASASSPTRPRRWPPPAEVKLKDPSAWRLIGNEKLRRLDSVAKTTGRQQFPIDVYLPGMLTAVIAHPPLFGAKVSSFDAAAAKAVKGVVDVVETPRGIAVVATDTWAAIKGREALQVEWDESGAETARHAPSCWRSTRSSPAPARAPWPPGRTATRRRRSRVPPRWSRPSSSSPTSPTRRWSRSTPRRGSRTACSRSGPATRCPTSTRRSRPRSWASTRRR